MTSQISTRDSDWRVEVIIRYSAVMENRPLTTPLGNRMQLDLESVGAAPIFKHCLGVGTFFYKRLRQARRKPSGL